MMKVFKTKAAKHPIPTDADPAGARRESVA
jgi:hypothetical protein